MFRLLQINLIFAKKRACMSTNSNDTIVLKHICTDQVILTKSLCQWFWHENKKNQQWMLFIAILILNIKYSAVSGLKVSLIH